MSNIIYKNKSSDTILYSNVDLSVCLKRLENAFKDWSFDSDSEMKGTIQVAIFKIIERHSGRLPPNSARGVIVAQGNKTRIDVNFDPAIWFYYIISLCVMCVGITVAVLTSKISVIEIFYLLLLITAVTISLYARRYKFKIRIMKLLETNLEARVAPNLSQV